MKKLIALISLLAGTVTASGQLADLIEMPGQAEEQDVSYSKEEILRTWGWLLSERFNLGSFDFNSEEIDLIADGLAANIRGEVAPTDPRESTVFIQEYFVQREEAVHQRKLEENREKEQVFFDQLMGIASIKSLGTGLHYEIIRPGNDVKPKSSDKVIVHYEGRFLDNKVFDSTVGGRPMVTKLDEVILGWGQGLPLIGEGGKIKLYVPSKLGYGDEGRPSIPPGATLVFEVELLKVGLPDAPLSPESVEALEFSPFVEDQVDE